MLWFSLWDVYRHQPMWHSSCRFSTMYGSVMSCVTWSCEKIQTLFIFRAIWENAAHVQWIMCSPKGSHLFSLNECCIFPYRTQMSTVCKSYQITRSVCHQRTYSFFKCKGASNLNCQKINIESLANYEGLFSLSFDRSSVRPSASHYFVS